MNEINELNVFFRSGLISSFWNFFTFNTRQAVVNGRSDKNV